MARAALTISLGFALTLGLGGESPAQRADDAPLGEDGHLCRYQTDRQGRLGGLPKNLLTAISFVESGRWDGQRRKKIAWPWTVTSGGEGRFFASKADAISDVRRLQRRGIQNIDVGCMQINLYYHGAAFSSLDDAFDPANNVAYAVAFLQRLHQDLGSWPAAAKRYHSATPKYADRYKEKIIDAWQRLNAANGAWDATGGEPSTLTSVPQSLQKNDPRSLNPQGTLTSEQVKRRSEHHKKIAANKARRDFDRLQAKAFAQSWRAEKLDKYFKAKHAGCLTSDLDATPCAAN